MQWRKELGKQIKAAREALSWTQQELADRVGLSRATLNYYENGASNKLSFEKVLRIARELRTEFRINGCLLNGKTEQRRSRLRLADQQFCLDFDKEQRFSNVTLSIQPSRAGVLIITSKAKTG